MNKKRVGYFRYLILLIFLIMFSIFSIKHFVIGGDESASVDALCPFGGFESMYHFFFTGTLVPRIMASSMILALAVVIITLLFNRGFCGWMCPFGTVQELLGKLTKKKIKVKKSWDKKLRYLKHLVLIVVIIGTAITGTLVIRGFDPFMTFFHFGKGIFWGGYEPAHLTAFIITIIVLCASIFIERFWCKYFCPLGAVTALLSLNITRINRDKKTCIDCKICDKVCPVNVHVSTVDYIKDSECIECNACVNKCPKNSLEIRTLGKKISPIIYSILLVGLFFGVILSAKAIGIWQSVPVLDTTEEIHADEISGWMTLNQVAENTGININHFLDDLNLPPGFDTNLPLKEVKEVYGNDFHTETVREYVKQFEHNPAHHPAQKILCPWNIKEDYFPGKCGLYVDKDGNSICDLSE